MKLSVNILKWTSLVALIKLGLEILIRPDMETLFSKV